MSNGELIPENTSDTNVDFIDLDILSEAQSLLYNNAYHELSEVITGQKPSRTPPPEDEFKVKVAKYIDENREELYQKICIEFGYCEKRQNSKNMSEFINGLAILLAVIFDSISCGAASAIWIMSTSLLDELCGCSR
jgi:hypothetical protein